MELFRFMALSMLLSLAGSVSASEDPGTARFRALEEAWTSAIKSQDRARLESFLRPDYTLTVARPGKPLESVDRASWLKNATTAFVIHEFQFRDIVVRDYGDIAVVSSRYLQKATISGRFRDSEAFLTDIWVRTGEQWQVSARYSSHLNPAAPGPSPEKAEPKPS